MLVVVKMLENKYGYKDKGCCEDDGRTGTNLVMFVVVKMVETGHRYSDFVYSEDKIQQM